MLYTLLSFYQLMKKQYKLLGFMCLGIYIILLITIGTSRNIYTFGMLLGCPPFVSPAQILWTIFQISCHIYMVYTYLQYEQDSSYEYIILRESEKTILIKKFFLLLAITIFIRLLIFFFTYSFFFSNIDFPITGFFYNIGVYIGALIVSAIVKLMIKKE